MDENNTELEPTTPATDPTPAPDPILTASKLALRLTTDAYNDQLTDLIDAAKLDLGVAGVVIPETIDKLVRTAIVTYVCVHFGSPADYDRLKRSYDEQKAQLKTCTGYTNWG